MEKQQGSALIATVLLTVMLTIMATASLNLGAQEIRQSAGSIEEASAKHAADAAIGLVMQAFHDPHSELAQAQPAVFTKRAQGMHGESSFFDTSAQSQFRGTSNAPDLTYDATRATDDRQLNDARVGWFRTLGALARVLKVKAYGPMRPGLLCTLEVEAQSGSIHRSVSVQLGALSIPPLRSAMQAGTVSLTQAAEQRFPISSHWGAITIEQDAHLGLRGQLPIKSALAPVTGQPYGELVTREDRWLDIWIGGNATFTSNANDPSSGLPANVYPLQNPVPGLQVDRWDYGMMKKAALSYGTYYARGTDGLLYLNGQTTSGQGRTLDEIMKSDIIGQHHGLVFVDTLDGTPPRPDNLGTLKFQADYAEGIFVINANLEWHASHEGKTIPALSPPNIGATGLGTRVPVEISGIHMQGVLYTPGSIVIDGSPKAFGSVVALGEIKAKEGGSLEIWYQHELRSGLYRGIPVVFVAPGTRTERY
jgi:hypothetical protein